MTHRLYSRTVLRVLYGRSGFLIGPILLFAIVKLGGGGTGMSTMTAVDKYGEVMCVLAWKTERIEITYRSVVRDVPRPQSDKRQD